eukprot:jgi/Psemu1/69872/estExt_Genemark1.C_11180004
MAAVIGRGIERIINNGAVASDEVYDPSNPSNQRGLQSPFVLYFTITFFTNGIAVVGGIASQFDLHRRCGYYRFDWCDAWFFANACFGILHIGAALYLVRKIRAPEFHANPAMTMTSTTAYAEDGKGGEYKLHNPRELQRSGVAVATAAPARGTSSGPPDSLRRIRYILCESRLFAVYLIVFAIYLCWHFFLDVHPCNLGMAFAMRCADIFIWAAPCSFVFSVGTLMQRQGRL